MHFCFVAAAVTLLAIGGLCAPIWPSDVIPANIGVNIHYTVEQPGTTAFFGAAGFRWARMDLLWERVERAAGQYDWGEWDTLTRTLEASGIKGYFILDYGNPIYGGFPKTQASREAFARFAVAAVSRYAGKQFIFECWNEPTGGTFGQFSPKDYAALANTVGAAVKAAHPNELLVGPALKGQLPWDFLEGIFQLGVLTYFDGVSIHPYRGGGPESVTSDYHKARELINKYGPKDRYIPVIAGEWGYNTAHDGENKPVSETAQAKYLARMFLWNVKEHIPVTIWYDCIDDQDNTTWSEANFGLVHHDYYRGRTPPYDLKPAYTAAFTFMHELAGFRFNQTLNRHEEVLGHHALQFTHAQTGATAYAVWNDCVLPLKTIAIDGAGGCFDARDYMGNPRGSLCAHHGKITIEDVEDAPIYLVPQA